MFNLQCLWVVILVFAFVDSVIDRTFGSEYLPVTPKPFEKEIKITASDAGTIGLFGRSVAISGNTAIVGTVSGSAYLFDVRTGSQLGKLSTTDSEASDAFGPYVAISGNTAIVGSPFADDNGYDSGAAYLFDVTTGNQLAKLTASDVAIEDNFGFSVAISGNMAIVGSPFADDNGYDSGAAYLFDVTTGNQLAKLTASDAAIGDYFGISVAISGNTAIVGATNGDANSGAYLFDVTTGKQIAKLTAMSKGFGVSVSISGDTAIVGAIYDDDVENKSGAAYLFDVTTGNQIAKLTATDAVAGDRFGWSVAISGNTAIIGAGFGNNFSGAAYMYDVPTGNLLTKLTGANSFSGFGSSVAINGFTAIVGAELDVNGDIRSGSAYLFVPEPSSYLLAIIGLVSLVAFGRKLKKSP